MKCKNCGSELKENAKFCTTCGAPIAETENFVSDASCEQEFVDINDSNYESNNAQSNTKVHTVDKKKLTISVIAVCVFVALIAVLSVVISNATATSKLNEALDSGNAYEVNALYSEAYDSNSKIEKYDNRIAEFLNEVKEDLNSQNFDEEAVVSGADTVPNYVKDKYGTLILSDDGLNIDQSISMTNRELWDELLNLISSKNQYCSGVYSYKTDNDYQQAITYFAEVDENDSLYENSKTMIGECADAYISSILQQVDEYIQNDDIGSGIDLLETSKSWLDENGVNSEEIQTKIDEVLVSYAEKYAANAENAFKEHDVNAAIGNIEVAMELQPDNGDYKSKYDTYQQYLPFNLYEEANVIAVEDVDASWDHFDSHSTANDNSEMLHVISIGHDSYETTNVYNIQYNLSAKYDTVTGTLFIADTYKNTVQTSYFEAYGDGKLLYTSPKMEKGVLPQDISFNVSGVQKLEIKFYTKTDSTLWGSEICISNLTAQKNFPE